MKTLTTGVMTFSIRGISTPLTVSEVHGTGAVITTRGITMEHGHIHPGDILQDILTLGTTTAGIMTHGIMADCTTHGTTADSGVQVHGTDGIHIMQAGTAVGMTLTGDTTSDQVTSLAIIMAGRAIIRTRTISLASTTAQDTALVQTECLPAQVRFAEAVRSAAVL